MKLGIKACKTANYSSSVICYRINKEVHKYDTITHVLSIFVFSTIQKAKEELSLLTRKRP
jgi:hypothetical protein